MTYPGQLVLFNYLKDKFLSHRNRFREIFVNDIEKYTGFDTIYELMQHTIVLEVDSETIIFEEI